MRESLRKTYDFTGDVTDLLEIFQNDPFVFLLDSSLSHPDRGRFSFLGFAPFKTFQSKGRNSLDELRADLREFSSPRGSLPILDAGMVGYFGYDFGLHLENIPLKKQDDLSVPDCFFGFYDCVLTLDHLEKKLHISSSGFPEKNPYLREKRAAERLSDIEKRLGAGGAPRSGGSSRKEFGTGGIDLRLKSNLTPQQYRAAVEKALTYITGGDIYQVNLAQRFVFHPKKTDGGWDIFEIYRSLRKLSPAHFSGLMNCGDFWILSSSPERFLRLSGDLLETRPMKGTRPRGVTAEEDRRLKDELLKSPKDAAELLMITDLERNDLGRVCRYGSVKVREMRSLEEYRTVFQTTSTVEGRLRDDKDALDVIEACFPGGSITGCPKIRAMEIIEELEPARRGIYTGALGYISFSGDMDFNILIRTLLLKDHKIYFHVGGGIVTDSDPDKEYEETLVKARAMGMCLEEVFGERTKDLLWRASS